MPNALRYADVCRRASAVLSLAADRIRRERMDDVRALAELPAALRALAALCERAEAIAKEDAAWPHALAAHEVLPLIHALAAGYTPEVPHE